MVSGLLLLAAASDAHASKIVVNEFYRGLSFSSTGDEWVELVLLQDMTDTELNGFFVGDSTSATASKFGSYQFQNMGDYATLFPAGTILVVAGGIGPAEDLTYDPAAGDWNLVFQITNTNLLGNGSTMDFASTDVVFVDTNGTNGDDTLSVDGFAVNYDSTPGVFGALANVTVTAPSNNTGVVLSGATDVASDATSWTTSVALADMTPGGPNGGDNSTSIADLQALFGGGCIDTDFDTICDTDDLCPADFDPTNADEDIDGIGDACDACVDVDGDAICAGADLCPVDFDPTNADLDLDGIGDVCDPCLDIDFDGLCAAEDLCPADFDPNNTDADNDGLGDACEGCVDLDNDLVCAPTDLCPDIADPTNADLDLDGVGDACDSCVDIDYDSLCAPDDLCPVTYDPTNVDVDLDGIGDVCDDCIDVDGDGVCADVDTCPDVFDPANADKDADGIGDVCDVPTVLGTASPSVAGQNNTWTVVDGAANTTVVYYWSSATGNSTVAACPGVTVTLKNAKVLGRVTSDAAGTAALTTFIPAGAAGKKMYVQAVFTDALCFASNRAASQF